ncbi:hypothetical protein GLOIN_2v1639675 [Rhizophagus clarus]|uniref:Uncharacterized protein n=1 Tax=Rhizophagus clarus TaxID=94130 RepID=A0A8H3QZ94_9GLOM|nr:hypothetical protein GLOIN_2v1639675 [Rhizophagus clarus]
MRKCERKYTRNTGPTRYVKVQPTFRKIYKITRSKMSTADNSDIISLNLRFRNSQNRNVIFVIEVSKNDLVSVITDRVRAILAPHLPVRPHNFHLQQIHPTSIERRRMQPENIISVYFPENPDEDMIHIFVYPPPTPE